MKILLVLSLLVFAATAGATTLHWTPPTTNVNGSIIHPELTELVEIAASGSYPDTTWVVLHSAPWIPGVEDFLAYEDPHEGTYWIRTRVSRNPSGGGDLLYGAWTILRLAPFVDDSPPGATTLRILFEGTVTVVPSP